MGNDELAKIYRHARCFVYPSRYEGFGLPIVEAIQCGLPVVAATGSCLEEAGGPDSMYVSPDDPKGLAAAIGRLIADDVERRARASRARAYVRRFEDSDVAGQVLRLYDATSGGLQRGNR